MARTTKGWTWIGSAMGGFELRRPQADSVETELVGHAYGLNGLVDAERIGRLFAHAEELLDAVDTYLADQSVENWEALKTVATSAKGGETA